MIKRMPISLRTLALLLIAAAAGLVAAWAAGEHIQARLQLLEDKARVQVVQRIVAARHLEKGALLTTEHLAIREFPANTVSSDSLPPERFTELLGHVLQSDLRAGDAVLALHAMPVANAPFSGQLASGRRAITMPVDTINSVSGLLEPGDLIDLYVSFDYQRRKITAPLLQGVLVLATGARTGPIDSGGAHFDAYSSVTLDAAPEDAIKLVAARQSGTLTAVLRNPGDKSPSQRAVRGDLASILGIARKMPSPAANKKAQIIYGNSPSRQLSSLKPRTSEPQRSGVFDLPYLPDLTSAWRQALQNSDTEFLDQQRDPEISDTFWEADNQPDSQLIDRNDHVE